MLKKTWLGKEGLTDVGYQVSPNGNRIITGISEIGNGWYEANMEYDETDYSSYVDWNSLVNPEAESREYFNSNYFNKLTVTVLNATTSKPVHGAIVRASNGSNTMIGITDLAGKASIVLPNSQYVVSVIKKDYSYVSKNVEVTLNNNETEFQIYPITNDIDKIRMAEGIWRDAQLPDDTLSFMTNDDAIEWITTTILPETEAYVDSRINAAVMPLTYPIETRLINQAFPDRTYTQVSLLSNTWEATRTTVIRFLCLYRIFLLADSVKKEYLAKAEAFRKVGEESLTVLVQTLTGVITSLTTGGKKFGFVHLRLPKQRKKNNNEFSSYY